MLQLFCKQCNKKVEAIPLDRPKADYIASCPHCGSMLSPHRLLAPGTIINNIFRIEREIGRGGMGIVYLAKQLDLDRDVALKVLSDEMASDKTFIDAFFREAKGAAALNHPNIVQAIDAGISGDIHYFVMELIEGENLEVYTAQKGALPTPLALKCATSIADALTYAWDCKKLAHRDIKPENIIMKSNSEFKLADLGLVKDCKEGAAAQDENLMATPAYAPPEIIRGEKDVPGFKSDMYSFGATLYQLFAGHAPFVHDDPMVVCEMQQENQPPPLIAVNSALPPEISMLVDKLMEKDPGKRPGSWSTVLHSLNEITYVWHMTNQQATPPPSPAENGSGKQKILIGAVILLTVCLLAELVLFFLLPKSPVETTENNREQQKTTENNPKHSSDNTTTGSTALISTPAQTPTPKPAPASKQDPKQTVAKEPVDYTPASQPQKDPFEDMEDDPDELKRWKKEIKPILPEDPYTRWEALKEYLEDNLYAPKDARKMFRALEQKKDLRIKELKKMKKLCEEGKASLSTCRTLVKSFDSELSWAVEVFSPDEMSAINQKCTELEEKVKAASIARQKKREIARKQEEARQLQNRIQEAKSELLKIRKETLSAHAQDFQIMTSDFRNKYADLPDFEDYSEQLEKLEKIRNMAKTPLFDLIRLNQKHLKGQIVFPTHYPTYTFRSAENETMFFLEKKGTVSTGQKLHATWLEENLRVALEDLFYQCTSQLQDFNKDSLVTLFVIAQCNGFPVRQYLKRYSWLPKRTREEVFMLLNEIHQMQK